ncbi:MAG: nucleoside recognition domain-containing protein, partial [Candidatus Margulisiibacteriota bacterium]
NILVGKLFDGQIDYLQSFGVLSTGVYVELAMVLPYVFSFYLVLGLLEDSGYLPRLAVMLDNLMHKVGLHGFAIVPTLLAFGCNVPGILATRVLDSKRERFIASTLISIGIPCAALQAMIIGVLGSYGAWPIVIVYLFLFLSWVILGTLLNRLVKGFSPELLLEIPPYRMPPLRMFYLKIKWRIKQFLWEAAPIVLAGVFAVNIMYSLGLFDIVASAAAPLVTGLWGLPKEAVSSIAIGFLRKDVAVGMLAPLGLTVKQLIISCVVLSMFFPCIATFTVLLKELGFKAMIASTAIMVITSVAAGTLLNMIL